MLIAETIRISLSSIRGNIFRSMLTMLGIIIGVGAVITMVALGTGAQRKIDEQMAALGGDILSIQASSWFSRGVARDQQTLTTDDAMALATGPRHIAQVTPEINQRFQVKYGNKNLNLSTIGTTPNYANVHGFRMAAGRMFTAADEAARRRVVVLGAEVPDMFDAEPAAMVGRTVQVRAISFEVIGVLDAKGGSGWLADRAGFWRRVSNKVYQII